MKRKLDDLPDHTVQGIYEAYHGGDLCVSGELDSCVVRSVEVLAEKGYWMWMFMSCNDEVSTWQDLEKNYWNIDPEDGYIWEFGT